MNDTDARVRPGRGWIRYGRTPRTLLRDPSITAQAKALFAAIADHAGDDGAAWPSQQTLAGYFGVTARSVRAWLAELVTGGWITVLVERTKRGRRNVYEVNLEAVPQAVDKAKRKPRKRKPASPRVRKPASPRVRKPASPEVEPVEVEPVEEPSSSSATSRARPSDGDDDDDQGRADDDASQPITADRLYADAGIDAVPTDGVRRLVEHLQTDRGWGRGDLREVAMLASAKRDPLAWMLRVWWDLHGRAKPPVLADLWSADTDADVDAEYWAGIGVAP